MGNFSVSHYARIEVTQEGVSLEYVLDLAEIPTFDLLRSWNLNRNSPREVLEAKAREQTKIWVSHLQISSNLGPVQPRLLSSSLVIADGAANLPIARIASRLHLDGVGTSLSYEDANFPDRAGWKEIVVLAKNYVRLRQTSQSTRDISKALTEYPPDPTLAPPQDLRAELAWTIPSSPLTDSEPAPVAKIVPIPQPKRAAEPVSPVTRTQAAAPPGSVVRGDFLSTLLHERALTPWTMFLGLAAAFLLGGAHALTPGHGKTIVAAYLVGSRGTLKHAAFLGAVVTFTHTISVFLLGLATLFLFNYVVPEKITQWLGVISGLSIVAVGLWMARKRWQAARAHPHHDHHHHHHDHHQDHGPGHGRHDHHHDHGPSVHSHVPAELSWAGLTALAASGGLVPCESALVLLLGAIALGRVGLGLMLLVSFSFGLAIVLMAVGGIVLYARNLLPAREHSRSNGVLRYLSLASAAVVTLVGIVMTGLSLGWIRANWTIG
jgi:ABC-type nickel/cobalt efflux system permease component RcnA